MTPESDFARTSVNVQAKPRAGVHYTAVTFAMLPPHVCGRVLHVKHARMRGEVQSGITEGDPIPHDNSSIVVNVAEKMTHGAHAIHHLIQQSTAAPVSEVMLVLLATFATSSILPRSVVTFDATRT